MTLVSLLGLSLLVLVCVPSTRARVIPYLPSRIREPWKAGLLALAMLLVGRSCGGRSSETSSGISSPEDQAKSNRGPTDRGDADLVDKSVSEEFSFQRLGVVEGATRDSTPSSIVMRQAGMSQLEWAKDVEKGLFAIRWKKRPEPGRGPSTIHGVIHLGDVNGTVFKTLDVAIIWCNQVSDETWRVAVPLLRDTKTAAIKLSFDGEAAPSNMDELNQYSARVQEMRERCRP